jgi:hypothetical protein
MRRLLLAAAALALTAVAASPAAAATAVIKLTPATGTAATKIVVRGTGWPPPNEFCTPRITVKLLGVTVARTLANDAGKFTTWFRIPEAVGPGKRSVVATQRCESGNDGSLIPWRGTARLTVT